jgi:hypothetical protein
MKAVVPNSIRRFSTDSSGGWRRDRLSMRKPSSPVYPTSLTFTIGGAAYRLQPLRQQASVIRRYA